MNNFTYITDLIKSKSGIVIDASKEYLLESRLKPIARKNNYENIDALIEKIKLNNDPELLEDVIEAMTTNESLFFRDQKPFDQLKNIILPEFQNKPLKIWSAAASTGQEIYSTVITLQEAGFLSYQITGTDISPAVIQRSNDGKYSQFEIQRGMPITYLMKYFTQEGENWIFKPEYKTKVKFQVFNLLDQYTSLGTFDLIMCRNVLIYFDRETKAQIYDKMHRILNPNGYLILGSSESVINNTDKFKSVEGQVGLFKPIS